MSEGINGNVNPPPCSVICPLTEAWMRINYQPPVLHHSIPNTQNR